MKNFLFQLTCLLLLTLISACSDSGGVGMIDTRVPSSPLKLARVEVTAQKDWGYALNVYSKEVDEDAGDLAADWPLIWDENQSEAPTFRVQDSLKIEDLLNTEKLHFSLLLKRSNTLRDLLKSYTYFVRAWDLSNISKLSLESLSPEQNAQSLKIQNYENDALEIVIDGTSFKENLRTCTQDKDLTKIESFGFRLNSESLMPSSNLPATFHEAILILNIPLKN